MIVERKCTLWFLLLFIVPLTSLSQHHLDSGFSAFTGDYLGMKQPDNKPLKFAPGFISVPGETNQCLTFSPDGRHFVYVWADSTWSRFGLVYSRRIGDRWLNKTLLRYKGSEQVPFNPTFSPDSKQIIFSKISTTWPDTDIYTLDLLPDGYASEAALMNSPINTEGLDFDYFSDRDSIIYFTGQRPDFMGGTFDIYSLNKQNNVVTNLKTLNSPLDDAAPYLSPDGTYMVFEKMVNDSHLVYNDSTARIIRIELYVSFCDKTGKWSAPINLGPQVNSKFYRTYRPVLSADGKFLFFTRREQKGSSIYWVSTRIIDKLKPE